ncbi:UNVERIFIED_CONTAM: hypothetical protein Sangu_2454600 [Sesamum angustifolium]|uniref:ATP-dependent DNA helicase n=1 Tax=Sesamum angustifolium TaxID=2727405 RepID=A0AAW2KYK8_9LAMI
MRSAFGSRRQNYQQQRQMDENDASIQESMQRRREINHIRSRERRERMTTEQREVYLARRRHLYHLRRGNNTIPAVVADVNAYQTTSRHTQALHIEGNQGVVPLARSIPIPITIADGNCSVTSTSVAQTSGSAINTTVGTTLLRQIPLANFAQVPANQLEASTSRAQPSNNRDNIGSAMDRVVGNISLRHIPASNFDRVPPNQFEASTSRARPSNSGDHDNNDYNLSSSSSDDLHNPPNVGEGVNYIRPQNNRFLNDARNYYPASDGHRLQLPNPRICSHCRAKLFLREAQSFCCRGGKVMLPKIPVLVDLIRLFTDQSAEGRIFRQNIRAYNHVFSFTSLGVALDQSLAPFDQGIYTFRAHGSIYHRIGSLLPLPGTRPRYIQMFIYDTEHEIENSLQESNGLDGELVDKVKHILDAHNPFVKTLRQLAQRPDINNCKLVIKEKPAPNMQYTLPTASQVAAILVGGEEIMDANARDIIVQSNTGRLFNIKEYSGYYDPLQYPLLLPYGTYGWDCDFRSFQGNRITCCDYYAYILYAGLFHLFFSMEGVYYNSMLLTTMSRLRLKNYDGGILGKAVAHVHVIEFQKRGLPHVHMSVIFDEDDKLNTPDDYDCIVRAEIPKQPVIKHMIHGPCGHIKPNAPCMKNGKCKKGYPKQFAECTMQGNDSYPIYQRRNDNRLIALDNHGEVAIDNSWVVPYNPWLLLKYDCHINVEMVFISKNLGKEKKHSKGPKSFDDLLTIDGVHYLTFKQAAEKRGFLQEDNSIRECLVEARSFRMPSALRRLFATILLYCEPNGVRSLWEENYSYMIEDYPSSSSSSSLYVLNKLLHDLNGILMQHKESINEFDLPQITGGFEDLMNIPSRIEHELSIPISETDLNAVRVLNNCQFSAFDIISRAIRRKHSAIFFVDGPGGTGKTFLYKSLLANFRKDGLIMLAIATSGIAANLLPGGRTAHSKLKIPIKFEPLSMCLFSKQSELSTLIERASAIIWDEAPPEDARRRKQMIRCGGCS